MNNLLALRCKPQAGSPMTDAEIEARMPSVPGWARVGNAIERSFKFANFHETMAFVNALAWVCHCEDHHPELRVSYGRCVIRFDTHSVGGLSINDFICAAKANALVVDS